jgi:hypothetical protein
VSEDAFGGVDEVETARGVSSRSSHNGSGVGESDLQGKGRPVAGFPASQMKEKEDVLWTICPAWICLLPISM